MKIRTWILVLLLLMLAIGGSQAAPVQELVIDNFISDQAVKRELVNGRVIIRRSGDPANIVGGARETEFEAVPLPDGFARATLLEIPRNGPMFLESGVKSTFRVVHFYGEDRRGRANPLNLQLLARGYDRFRIEFDSCDVELNYLIQVFDGNGNNSFLSGAQSTADKVVPFNVDFLFADFSPGAPGPINWDDIDGINVLFQTGNAVGGADFTVRRVIVLPPQ